MRRVWVLFAGFVAGMEDARLPKCVMFEELVGGVGGQEKEWMGCLLNDLKYFGINAGQWTTVAQDEGEWRKNDDKWTTTAQDEGEWRKTVEQGEERFMAKLIAAEKARAVLRHAAVCPNGTGRWTKEIIAQIKRARTGWLAIPVAD